ncbi:tannase/feruloyl esterase family alpha/beta hydrolase [Piscinibacter sakaiensis]|uniref:Tannase/feruloyl esterase n=1 Tax=Piscinibacter sakaiensis TaxID=1547922 RepID=A0A0K8P8M6_PISS1|nr:tannase/feruloyl esterase family alpha/beta hydrolase [Piscinibacter sakaiensis]GAP38545.1 tannase/feruloyl esterase [Piscinibacter sakaiensis]
MHPIAAMALAFSSALFLAACGGQDDELPTPVTKDAQAACAALASTRIPASAIGLPTTGARIDRADLVPVSATNSLGEYCLAVGRIDPVDPAAQPIGFNVALPTAWNGKAMQLGGGAWSGFLFPANGASSYGDQPVPVARGYAVVATDGGHQGGGSDVLPDARFAMNDELLRNFGGDHLKKAHDVALALIRIRYDAAPAKTYFMGDSGGGHQAMLVLQRWPQDYDGIIAVYPALAWTSTFMKLQMIGREMRREGGAGWINPAKSEAIRVALLGACDAGDGLVDGNVSNPHACRFDLDALLCPGGGDAGDACLSAAQLRVLKAYVDPAPLSYSLAHGIRALPSFRGGEFNLAKGAFTAAFGNTAAFDPPAAGGSPRLDEIGANHWFGDTMVRGAILQDLQADSLAFDPLNPGVHLARLQHVSAILDATSAEIQPFLARRGKLLLVHGTADPLIPAQASIDYYRSIVQRFGQPAVDASVRFYLVPGYAHAAGISFNATRGLPLLSALEAWVEGGTAPADNLIVTDTSSGAGNRTRPLCRYPTWPQYRGSGDPSSAASFRCAAD